MIRMLVVVLALVACSPAAASGHDVTGTFDLVADEGAVIGNTCTGEGGYDDIEEGAQIKVTNEDGTLIGTASLGRGSRVEGRRCRFEWTASDLPDAAFYNFELGRRGELTYSKADMEAADWTVGMTLGE